MEECRVICFLLPCQSKDSLFPIWLICVNPCETCPALLPIIRRSERVLLLPFLYSLFPTTFAEIDFCILQWVYDLEFLIVAITVSPSTFCILSSFVEQSSDTCKTNSNKIRDNEWSNYMKFLKGQGRDLEIIFPQVDVKIQGDS